MSPSLSDRVLSFLRGLGPATPSVTMVEALRAGIGACLGLTLAGLFVLSPSVDFTLGLYLIAPFGASSVLLFAVPNSPLAQPWPAVVGNMLAALIGVAVSLALADPLARIALAVGLVIIAMLLCRAVHPPAGAVAMTAAMSPEAVAKLGFWFALMPVGVGTALLVGMAMIYARLTGRHYPLRRFEEGNTHGTADPNPMERLGLDEGELTALLERYRQSLNMGVEDLARLVGAAELQAAGHRTGALSAGDIMSRDLVTVGPHAPLGEVADLFRRHGFTALPVVEASGRYLGVIFQIHLIGRIQSDAQRLGRGFRAAMRRLLDREREMPVRAQEVMGVGLARAHPATPIAALLPMMAQSGQDAVPVLDGAQIVGIVTRTDLIAALARLSLRGQDPAQG